MCKIKEIQSYHRITGKGEKEERKKAREKRKTKEKRSKTVLEKKSKEKENEKSREFYFGFFLVFLIFNFQKVFSTSPEAEVKNLEEIGFLKNSILVLEIREPDQEWPIDLGEVRQIPKNPEKKERKGKETGTEKKATLREKDREKKTPKM